jgi:sugar phosphate isomerase/epimerase
MKLGASTIPFGQEPLDEAMLATFKEAGIESLELCDYHSNFNYTDPDFRRFLQRSLSDMEFHLNSIHIHLNTRDSSCDLATLDKSAREKSLDDHRQAVDFAAALGGCILVTHDLKIPEPEQEFAVEKREAFLQNLGELAAYAAPLGVRFALENMGLTGYTGDPSRLIGLMDDLGAANVGVVIDTGHRNLSGEPAAALHLVRDHLITLHLHDNHGERDEHLLPGRGDIAWDQVMRTLKADGYPGVLMYEVNRVEDLSELRKNAAWLHSL